MYRFILLLLFFQGIYGQQPEQPSNNPNSYEEICPSQIYCHGELLDDVQSLRLFPDSKKFVDMKLKRDEKDIIEAYKEFKEKNDCNVDRDQMMNFINENFEEDKLIEWIPPDYSDYPMILNQIRDNNYKQFVMQVNSIWKQLARKVSDDVLQNPQLYSSIYLPNGFFIAGGRFTEMYFWDTYWIVEGALLCGMQNTVKGILKNMLYLVKKYGYVLNGSRHYYTKRSQPPLLIKMISTYYMFTKDIDFVSKYIKYMEQELNFWLENRTIAVEKAGNTYIMARYNTRTYGPRPESYYEDKNLTKSIPDEDGKNKMYSALKSAAESGWDFSTRHYINEGKNTGGLLKTDPQNLIYVDLNSILQSNCAILAEFFRILGDPNKTEHYSILAQRFQVGIDTLLWNEEENIWLDYDLTTKTNRRYFYASNLAPLWTGSYNKLLSEFYGDKVVEYLQRYGIINADLSPAFYCVPTSLYKSGEQWDFPNCWPPLQSMAIFGLERTKSELGKKVAFNLANSWVQTNYRGFQLSGHMYEKYSAIEFGKSGNGGEYVPQTGFGWTNGLLMHIFKRWGDVLQS